MKEEFFISSKKCICYFNDEKAKSKLLLIQVLGQHEEDKIDDMIQLIKNNTSVDFIYAGFFVDDWNKDLSPWQARAVFGDEDFAGGADKTLEFLVQIFLPTIKGKYGLPEDVKIILGGYSLSGLFSLWAASKLDLFFGVAAVSPSVWFDGYVKYAKENRSRVDIIYLSLGDREAKTKNKRMATVRDNIEELNAIFSQDESIQANFLEINKGNHFDDFEKRMAKGFSYCVDQMHNALT